MTSWSVLLIGRVPVGGSRALGDWQLARALARHRRVLYVDPPLSPRGVLREPSPRKDLGRVQQLGPQLESIRPLATPGANRPLTVQIGDVAIGTQVRRAARRLPGPVVLLIFDPKRGTMPLVKRDLLVYWRRDRLANSANTAFPELLRRRDHRLMRDADLVTGVSPPLVEDVRALGADGELVPNGCDYLHFSAPAHRPARFPPGRPVIGFAGGVSWRLDLELLVGMADARPEWTILLVGEHAVDVPKRPNIVEVGAQPYEALPGWIQHFDVGIIPYRRDRFNIAAAPLKVYEYLAAGVPVVSTGLPAIQPVPGLIATANDTEGFVDAVERSLNDPPTKQECQKLGSENDWETRVTTLEAHIEHRLRIVASPRRHNGVRP